MRGEVAVERPRARAHEARLAGRGVDLDGGRSRRVDDRAAVDLDADGRARGLELDADAVAAVDDERAQGAALRRERREDDRVERGRDRRAAGANGVRGRPRGRGHDDAVAVEGEHRLAPHRDAQARGAVAAQAPDDDVVERDDGRPALGRHRRDERGAGVDVRLAGRERVERPPEVGAVAVGQEADGPEVDAEHGRAPGHRELERAQDRPVAAQSDHEVAARGEVARLRAGAEVDDLEAQPVGPRLDLEQLRAAVPRRSGEHADRRGAVGAGDLEPLHHARSDHGSNRSIGMTRMRGSATVKAPTSSSRSKSSRPPAPRSASALLTSSRNPITPTRRPFASRSAPTAGAKSPSWLARSTSPCPRSASASSVRRIATSTTLTSDGPLSSTGRKSSAVSACTNAIGIWPDALRKKRPRTGWSQTARAYSRTRSHRGRSSGAGRRPSRLPPSVASMFSPSTRRIVSRGAGPSMAPSVLRRPRRAARGRDVARLPRARHPPRPDGHPAPGAGASTATTTPVAASSAMSVGPRHSAATTNSVVPSGPPSMHAKHPRSSSTVWSTSPPSRTRTQRRFGTSAYQTAPSRSMQMPSGTPSPRSAHTRRPDSAPSAAMSHAVSRRP